MELSGSARCVETVELWPNYFSKEVLLGESVMEVFSSLHAFCDWEDLALWVVMARRIWFRRNSVVHNGSFTHPNMVYREALLAHEEFKLCNLPEKQVALQAREIDKGGQILWKPHPTGVIKVNWDAAINKKKGCIGIDIIAHDCYSFFLGARSFSQSLVVDPKGVKAIAALNALIFSK
jgi:hypothetical protein